MTWRVGRSENKIFLPASADGSIAQRWKWRNVATSLLHSIVSGVWAPFVFYQVLKQSQKNLRPNVNKDSTCTDHTWPSDKVKVKKPCTCHMSEDKYQFCNDQLPLWLITNDIPPQRLSIRSQVRIHRMLCFQWAAFQLSFNIQLVMGDLFYIFLWLLCNSPQWEIYP